VRQGVDIDNRWIMGQYIGYWEFNFEEDERDNSKEAYEQILAETLGYCPRIKTIAQIRGMK
jgi:hypothetical protein